MGTNLERDSDRFLEDSKRTIYPVFSQTRVWGYYGGLCASAWFVSLRRRRKMEWCQRLPLSKTIVSGSTFGKHSGTKSFVRTSRSHQRQGSSTF